MTGTGTSTAPNRLDADIWTLTRLSKIVTDMGKRGAPPDPVRVAAKEAGRTRFFPSDRPPRKNGHIVERLATLLGRLSGAFGLTLSTLLSRAEEHGSRLCRRSNQAIWQDPETSHLRRSIVSIAELPLEMTEIVLPPDATVAFPREAYLFIRQAIWVMEGALEFTEGALTHHLSAGDSFVLGQPESCRFHNAGKHPCRYLVVVLRR